MTTLRSAPSIAAQTPEFFRAPVSKSTGLRVDRNGGYDRAGVIYGASLITQGEAEGHFMWIDGEFNAAVAQQLNSAKRGVKMRFTHPSLSGDGLGSFLGRAIGAKTVGRQVLSDLHFSKTAHSTPDGDLASYVMDLAENDPEAFGISIVFKHDRGAEDKHTANNENEDGDFESPDPGNIANLPHARLQTLRAADVVDSPAANPSGLFHRGQELASEAESLAKFALGLTADRPSTNHFSLDAERLASFATRFLDQNGLAITHKEKDMNASEIQSQVDAAVKTATEKLSADHKSAIDKLAAELAEAKKPLAGLSVADPAKEATKTEEALAGERVRIKELTMLHKNAGLSDDAILTRWIDKPFSLLEAKAEIADLAIKQNRLSADDPTNVANDQKNSEASLRAEYRQNAKLHASLGLNEDAWVKAEQKLRAAAPAA